MFTFEIPQGEQQSIIAERIKALRMDGFNQELNHLVAVALDDADQIEATQKTIDFIHKAIAAFEDALKGVAPDASVEPVTDPDAE